MLTNGVIQLGIVRSIFDSELYHSIALPTEPMIVATCEKWHYGKHRHSIRLNELTNKPLLLHRSNEKMLVECCYNSGFEPHILCRADDVRSLLVWANAGLGIAIVPRSALGLIPSLNLKYKEIIESALEIRKSIIGIKSNRLPAAAKHFLDIMLSDHS